MSYSQNKETWRKDRQKYRSKHREKELTRQRAWRASNRKHSKEYRRAYYQRSKGRWKAYSNQRRAIKLNASVDQVSAIADWLDRVKKKKWIRCYYCRTKILTSGCHMDHVMPLQGRAKRGGHTTENLCIACPNCNLSKHNRPLEEWQKRKLPQLLLL